MVWIKGAGIVVAVLLVVLVIIVRQGASHWAAQTRLLLERLDAARTAPVPARHDAARELEGLPAPVQRYFRAALSDGQAMVAAARLEHGGSFNLGETADRWRPFDSRQQVVTHRPGFVWDARVQMLPGLDVRVHDAYVAGEGILHPAILGLFTLADVRGSGEVARDELMRFLAEAAWYPTALLPSQGVRWQAVDDRSAHATLADGALTLSLLFRFGADGLIESVSAAARGRRVGDATVMTPWEGRWSNYQRHEGMQVPMRGEVAWLVQGGRKSYWRGSVTALHYEFAR